MGRWKHWAAYNRADPLRLPEMLHCGLCLDLRLWTWSSPRRRWLDGILWWARLVRGAQVEPALNIY
eukprot:1685116-Rhodomonas_salina.3